ncbi:hypothetical protein MAH1_15000 [Sessilibacter sp. MAH1]
MKFSKILMAMVLLCCWQGANAQFIGDVFFDENNVTVSAGQQLTLPAIFFAGADPMGGVEFEVSFDPAVLSLVDITAADGDFSGLFSSHQNNDGNYAIVVSNQTSLTAPTASVPLVNLIFEIVGSAGDTAQVQTTVRDSVTTSLVRYPASVGFVTTVTVQ